MPHIVLKQPLDAKLAVQGPQAGTSLRPLSLNPAGVVKVQAIYTQRQVHVPNICILRLRDWAYSQLAIPGVDLLVNNCIFV